MTDPSAPAVQVTELVKRFGEREALRGVSLSIAPGELFGLLGPNGGGKTTLFRILATLLRPTSGEAKVLGLDTSSRPDDVRRALGVVFQSPSLDAKLTVRENLSYQGALYGLAGGALRERIDELLRRFGLTDRAQERVERLSGGLRRRVDLARGLLHRPKVLLLDEPSTGLDPAARRELAQELQRLAREDRTTVLLTTHILDEADACDRIALIDGGSLVALGSPSALKAEIGADVVTVLSRDADALKTGLKERFQVEGAVLDGRVRFERQAAHAFIPKLIESFHGEILEVTLARPSLEDVFIRRTGHAFVDAPPPPKKERAR